MGTARAVSLALQGGGALGAFTWGVLDALLDDGRHDIEAISGASAGALNAVLLAQGLQRGGRAHARELLARFWTALADAVPQGMTLPAHDGAMLSPAARGMLRWALQMSPYQFNPLGIHPLRSLLQDCIDFEALRRSRTPRLVICATDAANGRPRLFGNAELESDVLLASTCLPWLHHAVRIGEREYWDGGFSANPPLAPLVYGRTSPHVLLVLASPLELGAAPRSAEAIRERTVELAFTTPLTAELQQIELARSLAGRWLGRVDRRLRALRLERIGPPRLHDAASARATVDARLFEALRAQGVEQARDWLEGGDARMPA